MGLLDFSCFRSSDLDWWNWNGKKVELDETSIQAVIDSKDPSA